MMEYCYKGFNISYEISKLPNNLYQATGMVCMDEYKGNSKESIKFHTENLTKIEAKNEIIKLIENFIDFEWKNAGVSQLNSLS